ncbi:YjcZ family sporulation protein [Paenibacillus sp. GCM10027629]
MSDVRGSFFTSTGTILVLFILLVIVSCACIGFV